MKGADGPQVLVVGGGVVGRSAAYYLSRAGARVELIDQGIGLSSTTRASLGVLTHFNGGDNPYSTLYRDGHALHAVLAEQLREETGVDVGWRPLGGIDLVFTDEEEAEARELLRFNQERGCPAEWVDAARLRHLEPEVSDRARGGVYFPGDQRVDPPRLAEALLLAAQQQGAGFSPGESLLAVEESDPGHVRVRTSARVRSADFAVLAAGAWTGELARTCGARVPVRPVRGQHWEFSGGEELRHLIRWNGHHLLPAGGQVAVGATVEEVGFELGTTAEAGERFARVFCRVLEREPEQVGRWAGLRPKPKGGRPLIGPLTGHPRIFAATGHYKNGILLGPLTGQVLSEWIIAGRPPRDMSYFTPER